MATHSRAGAPGTRVTELAHLPPEKVANLVLTRAGCRQPAEARPEGTRPATDALVQTILAHRPEDRLRTAGRLVRLGQTYGTARLEAACARAIAFGEADYSTVKPLSQGGHEASVVTAADLRPGERAYTFVRQASALVASLVRR